MTFGELRELREAMNNSTSEGRKLLTLILTQLENMNFRLNKLEFELNKKKNIEYEDETHS